MDIGTREGKGAQTSVIVDASVQFEPVVLALPVVAGVSDATSYSMPTTAYKFADWEHGGIHEAKLRFTFQQIAEQSVE